PRRATTSCAALRRSSRTTSSRPSATGSHAACSATSPPTSPPRRSSACPRSCSRGGRSTRQRRSTSWKRRSSRSRCAVSVPGVSRSRSRAPEQRNPPMHNDAVAYIATPDDRERQIELLSTTFNTAYAWNYEMVRRELHNLYEKAKRDQWNATEQLSWHLDVDAEAENLPDMQIPVYGTHIWEKLGPAELRT